MGLCNEDSGEGGVRFVDGGLTFFNPRPAGPLDFPPPAGGGGGAFERPP